MVSIQPEPKLATSLLLLFPGIRIILLFFFLRAYTHHDLHPLDPIIIELPSTATFHP